MVYEVREVQFGRVVRWGVFPEAAGVDEAAVVVNTDIARVEEYEPESMENALRHKIETSRTFRMPAVAEHAIGGVVG